MLNWSYRFNICCFLDDHNYLQKGNSFDCILAAGSVASVNARSGKAFSELYDFHAAQKDWLFGHLSFSLAEETEGARSSKPDFIQFPDLHFFVPQYLVQLTGNKLSVGSLSHDHEDVLKAIVQTNSLAGQGKPFVDIQARQSKTEYINAVERLRQHILRGDCYEVNYCQEFFAETVSIEPMVLFQSLQNASPAPFSAFYRIDEKYCLCASPERYLQKHGTRLMSQPIKGTRKRGGTVAEDLEAASQLLQSEKDRAENVMVVDLVRNDISKVCREGSVKVEELFGIYPFAQVYQMISTVTGEIEEGRQWVDAIRATFPMGSMTGAPKRRVLGLIDQYEVAGRGLYSGSIGYISPEGDFDLNVVIRSVLFNATTGYLCYHAGSAITFQSKAEEEYEECLLKAAFIRKLLSGQE